MKFNVLKLRRKKFINGARKSLTVCHRVHREVQEVPSCFREDRRVAEEAVLRDIHSGPGDNPARPHEVLRVDDVAADSVADKGRPPKPRPVVCWNSMVSDHRSRSCYHLSTIHSSSDLPSIFHQRDWHENSEYQRVNAKTGMRIVVYSI